MCPSFFFLLIVLNSTLEPGEVTSFDSGIYCYQRNTNTTNNSSSNNNIVAIIIIIPAFEQIKDLLVC